MPQTGPVRIEHDLLGDLAVPGDAYYGVQTARALDNFHISGVELRLYPDFIKASRWSRWRRRGPTPPAASSATTSWRASRPPVRRSSTAGCTTSSGST